MSFKNPIAVLLLLFAVGSAAYVLLARPEGSPAPAPATTDGEAPPPFQVIVYYLDMGKDCSTCLNLESYAREALETYFAPELARHTILWRTVDVDEPANEHFITDFDLYTKSIVLVRLEKGTQVRFDSLSRIWELVYDKEAYQQYIRKEVQAFLDIPGAAG